jgi:hypothetical protein
MAAVVESMQNYRDYCDDRIGYPESNTYKMHPWTLEARFFKMGNCYGYCSQDCIACPKLDACTEKWVNSYSGR